MESWMRMFSPYFDVRMPASGDLLMDYKPWTNWGVSRAKAGSPQIEAGVFLDVALPGRQLGKLTDAVLALAEIVEEAQPDMAERHPKRVKAIADLRQLANDIELKKKELKKTAQADALDVLDRLRRADSDAFESLIDALYKQNKDAGATKG